MQYTQFKKVVEIDNEIGNLHSKLAELYEARAMFASKPSAAIEAQGATRQTGQTSSQGINTSPAHQLYSDLSAAWAEHGIVIPSFSALRKQLLKSQVVLQNLIDFDASMGKNMEVLLVPPVTLLRFPAQSSLRRTQPYVALPDFVSPDLVQATKNNKKTWQVLVAHTGDIGIDYGNTSAIIKNKTYQIAGFDGRALGLRQYVALTLQLNKPIDHNVWTVLLNDKRLLNKKLVASATFMHCQFRFELDEYNTALGEERFRPAIEIKG